MVMELDFKDTFNMSDNIKSTCELMVEDTVDSKDNLEEDTREVAKIRIYHFTWIFFNLDVMCWGDIRLTSIFFVYFQCVA